MASSSRRVAVLGASGFIGSHVANRLEALGHQPIRLRTPRIEVTPEKSVRSWQDKEPTVAALMDSFRGADAVVNCSGNPDASGRGTSSLYGANAAIPGIAAYASSRAGVPRFVHVSSAVVQGDRPTLDASMNVKSTSAYGRSKILGERAVLSAPGECAHIIYRPPSVHGPTRRITVALRRIAQTPLSSVVAPGTQPTPQAHIMNVADAIATLTVTPQSPPPVVIHPYEGWTTETLLTFFGSGRQPLMLPEFLGRPLRAALQAATRNSRIAPNARRLTMLWFGQAQDESWLTHVGWAPVLPQSEWATLLSQLASQPPSSNESRLNHGK